MVPIATVAIAFAAVVGLTSASAAPGLTLVVNSTDDAVDASPGNGTCATAAPVRCTLRAAIQESNARVGADSITLPGGTYELAIPPLNQNLADNGDFDITDSLAITGAGRDATIVDGGTPRAGAPIQAHGLDRLFEVSADGATVAFSDLTLREGWAEEYGGALMNSSSAAISVIRTTITRSGAGKTGGGIDNHFAGSLEVLDSTLSDNYSSEAGSALNNNRGGALTIHDTVVASNSAADAGLDESLLGAGAIANNAELDAIGSMIVTDSQIVGNRAGAGRNGAGISNDGAGTVRITDTIFDDNHAMGDGGAIFNANGVVTVTRGTFTHNAGNNGGAISSSGFGLMEVVDSSFTKNLAADWGGAMHNGNTGSATVRSSTFTENDALNGGGFANEGSGLVTIESSTFTKNEAIDSATQVGGEGGGMHSNSGGEVVVTGGSFVENRALSGGGFSNEGGGSVVMTGTRVASNFATEAGGGILVQAGAVRMVGIDVVGNVSDSPLEGGGGISYAGDKVVGTEESAAIEGSRIRDNSSKGDGGGIDSRGDGPLLITTTSITGNRALIGGAVHHVGDATLELDRSTLSGNVADNGGGVFSDGDGEATIVNSTLSGNRASQFGGGLLVSSRVVVRNSTLSANGAAFGGGVNNGGGDLVGDGSVFLANTIVAGNAAGGNCAGTITSRGGNVENTGTCQLIELSDQPGTDPLLGPLASNGGPTQTHALLPGSPAQETAACTELDPCPAVDQRGITRPAFVGVDAGAYESETTPGGGGEQVCAGRTERPVPADFDTWVSESSPASNRGTDAILDVTSQSSANERALVHFTLPPMPPGCKLVGATLRLWASAATAGRTLEARRLATSWTELGVSWGSQPSAAGLAATTESALGQLEWNVLTQAKEMYASGAYGFVIRDASENSAGGSQAFHSREKGEDHPPELVLVFEDPDAAPSPGQCPTTPQLFFADRDAWVSEGSPTNNFGQDSTLKVKSQIANNARALLRFPLPTLPGGCTTVTSATLRLDVSSVKEGRMFRLRRAASAWTEAGVTWASQPETVGPTSVVPVAEELFNAEGLFDLDVTKQVLGSYVQANHGLVFADAEENGVGDEQTISSRDKVNDGAPELVLVLGDETPDTTLGPGPPSSTRERSATFTFSSEPADARFECSLDGAAFAACTSPHSVAGLSEGSHRFDVRAKRPVRAVDPTPASATWVVAIPPETTLAGPASPSASADAALTFSADDPEATFECSLDAEPWASCSSPVEYTNLADGERTFEVRATDVHGNVEPEPARHAWTIAVPPETEIDSGPPSLSASAAARFTFSATDNGPPGAVFTFACRLDDGAPEPCDSPQDYDALDDGQHAFSVAATDGAGNVDGTPASQTWTIDTVAPETSIDSGPAGRGNDSTPSFTFSATEEASFRCAIDDAAPTACVSPLTSDDLAEGEHTFLVEATDVAGNVEAEPASLSFVVDLTAPETTISDGPADPGNDTTPTFTFSASEEASFRCAIDDEALAACGSPFTSAALGEGAHTFLVEATDVAGNVEAETASLTFTIDLTAPETTIDSGPADPGNDATPSFTFSASENVAFRCAIDDEALATCASPFTSSALGEGDHTFLVEATDIAGNVEADAASLSFTVDLTAPETTLTDGPPALSNESDASFSFASTETSTFACTLDGTTAACTSPTTYEGLADGEHTFSVTATDVAGNVDSEPASQTWTVDTVAPETSIDGGPADPGNDTTPTFAFSAPGASGFRCSFDEGPLTACTSPLTSAELAEGAHTFFVEASDAAGNVEPEPASLAFTIDLTAPQTTIEDGPADPGNDSTPTFTFSASEEAAFRCTIDEDAFAACTSPFTSAPLSEGAHTFLVEATDTASNVEAEPATSSFTVDLTAPETTLTDGPPLLSNTSDASFSFNSSEAGSFACTLDDTTTACTSPVTYEGLADKAHTFSVTATDAAGNVDTSAASRAWTIDTVAPETTIDDGPADPGNDSTPTFVFSTAEAATFRCTVDEELPASCTTPFTTGELAEGEHAFSVQATDAAGNVEAEPASVAFTVDLTAPDTTIDEGPPALAKESDASFSFSSTEFGSRFACTLDGTTAACTSPTTYGGLADGEHTFSVTATDAAGNVDTSAASRTWTIDTVPPETSITDSPPALTTEPDASFSFGSESGAALACSLDGAAFSACESPQTYAGLGDGAHTFAVRATDTAGNADPNPAERTWTIDTTPPLTSIVSGPPATTTETSATFELAASEPATFECALDDDPFAACTSPHEVTGLALGPHELEVRATDAAGHTDATPASRTWTVRSTDTDPPETTITAGPTGPTTDSTPTFEFSANEPATFACRIDSNPFVTCTSPHTTSALTESSYTFEVRATDEAALSDETPASRVFTVDSTAPETSIIEGPPATTTSTSAEFEFTSTELGSSFECSLDGSGFAPCSSPASYTVGPGAHGFEVRARDAAGNTDTSPASRSWTVQEPDTAPPETDITSGPSGPTNDATPTFEFNTSETATFQCRVDTAPFASCTSPHTTASLNPGAHTFEVVATDAADNADTTPATRSFTVDLSAPGTTITVGPAATTSSTTAQFEFTSTETGSSFECSLDSTPFASCSSPETYIVGLGSHQFQVRARDAAGNLDESPASASWTVQAGDSTPPETTITGGPTGPTNDSTPTFTFSSSESGSVFQCRVDEAVFAACSTPHTTAVLAEGPHTFEVRARDAAGNFDLTPAARNIAVDTVTPETTITVGPSGSTNDSTPTFEFTASETATFQCRVDNAAFASCSSPHTTASLSSTSHTFQVRATDPAGTTDTTPASRTFTVDTTAPNTTITQAPPATTPSETVSFQFDSNETGAAFECSLDSSGFAPCFSPVSYTVAPGTHQFQVRARDTAGNTDGSPASASWTYQPPDTTPPDTTIMNGPPATTTDATVSFEFTSTETGSSFECSLDSSGFAPCSSPVSYTVAVGPHEFQVRARDAAGNLDDTPASRPWTREAPPPGTCIPSTVTRGAAADSWVLQSSSSSNYGNDSVLKVDSKSSAPARALVRFDLPALPAGCQVIDARLRLYASSYKTGRTIDVYALTSTWGESSVTWNSQPVPAGSASAAESAGGYVEWNVTVQLAGTYASNTGFLVRDRIENNGGVEQGFHSREKGADSPPQLVVTFG